MAYKRNQKDLRTGARAMGLERQKEREGWREVGTRDEARERFI